MSERLSKKLPKSNEYNLAVIQVLIDSKQRKLSAIKTADALNQAGLNTHMQKKWEAEHVRAALKRIRHKEYTGKLREAMLSLIHAGELTIPDCMALFQSNRLKVANGF